MPWISEQHSNAERLAHQTVGDHSLANKYLPTRTGVWRPIPSAYPARAIYDVEPAELEAYDPACARCAPRSKHLADKSDVKRAENARPAMQGCDLGLKKI